jgi:formylglycine-generating enzyme required for sulfatase activity
MIGNVWEWTTDWYGTHRTASETCCANVNPKGGEPEQSYDPQLPSIKIPPKVIKGGSF